MTPRTIVRRGCWALLFVYAAVSIAAGIIAAELSLHPPRRPLRHFDLARATAVRYHANLKDVAIDASDGAKLRGWLATPERGNQNVVLLFHGVSDNREGMAGFAEMFLGHGYSVLLMDSRAHGESGGALASYGLNEASDVHRWVGWLKSTVQPGCIFGLGESMGAAILLQSLHEEPSFCAVVAESSYQNFREIGFDRAAQFTHTSNWVARTLGRPAIEAGLLYARIRYGLDLTLVSPETAVAASRVPVLLIHGSNDVNTPPRHSVAIKARNPNGVSLWIVPGAVHTGASRAEPEEFQRRVLEWFKRRPRNEVLPRG